MFYLFCDWTSQPGNCILAPRPSPFPPIFLFHPHTLLLCTYYVPIHPATVVQFNNWIIFLCTIKLSYLNIWSRILFYVFFRWRRLLSFFNFQNLYPLQLHTFPSSATTTLNNKNRIQLGEPPTVPIATLSSCLHSLQPGKGLQWIYLQLSVASTLFGISESMK